MSQPAITEPVEPPAPGRAPSRLSYRQLPILPSSKGRMRALGSQLTLSVSRVVDIALADPALSLQLLREANVQAGERSELEITAVSHAVTLLGMEQTLGFVSRLPTLDSIRPANRRDGLLHAMGRAVHASGLASRWSTRRGEPAAETAASAVLVRHAAELVWWSANAEAATHFARLHHAGEERARVELQVFGCRLRELGERLATEAQLPRALSAAVDDASALQSRLAPSVLASALAEATASDWRSPRSQELCALYAELSAATGDRAIAALHSQTVGIARRSPIGRSLTAARYLLLPPGERFEAEELALPPARPKPVVEAPAPPRVTPIRDRPAVAGPASASRIEQAGETPRSARIESVQAGDPVESRPAPARAPTAPAAPSAPPAPPAPAAPAATTHPTPVAPASPVDAVAALDALQQTRRILAEVRRGTASIQKVLPEVIDGLRAGLGFERVVFALRSREPATTLRARYTSGEPSEPTLEVDLSRENLVTRLMQGAQGVWVHAGTREKLWPYLPRSVRAYAGERSFCIVTLFVRDRGVGIVYADYLGSEVNEQAYARFKRIVGEVADGLAPRRAAGG